MCTCRSLRLCGGQLAWHLAAATELRDALLAAETAQAEVLVRRLVEQFTARVASDGMSQMQGFQGALMRLLPMFRMHL